ncbi:hypothetical protein HELRODRAFT_179535 [Helobdella robusta]|uniref:Uncharacterized protein n=1 Tax=Helobdella robusta TaxID=6412 RepID=T1FEV0_HELRO|nr:hypothetical protein HELRODRAFT_179535 [Helobdella robusta]ESN95206.1 hypothetical protein HELRODRAFT_179535 [Helobdella robusta]
MNSQILDFTDPIYLFASWWKRFLPDLNSTIHRGHNSRKELEDVECKNPEAFSDRVESNKQDKQNKQEDFVSDVNRKQILLQRELDNALQNLNTLSRHSQTVSALSMIPFLVLFVSFIIAFYPFFANVTATTTFFLNN